MQFWSNFKVVGVRRVTSSWLVKMTELLRSLMTEYLTRIGNNYLNRQTLWTQFTTDVPERMDVKTDI